MSKNGRVTLHDKEVASGAGIAQFDETDAFAIDPLLLKELKEKGLAHRWINAKKWKDNYGFDPRMWAPYKRESKMTPGYEAYGITDSEGYTRRGDLILAAQSEQVAARRREKIANKNKALQKDHQKVAAEQLRRDLKGQGKVTEGYDEND